MTISTTKPFTETHHWDEFGNSMLEITVDVHGEEHPAERRTWEYPGCPAFSEVVGVTVTEIAGRRDKRRYTRDERPWLFERADKGVLAVIEKDTERYLA